MHRLNAGALALLLSAVWTGAAWAQAAQTTGAPQVAATPADAPVRMSGIWKLNKDLEKPSDSASLTDPGTAPTGGRSGGGSSGGYGGRTGGRMGGFGGGDRGGRGPESGNQQQMLQMRALMRETNEAPAQLVIVATATDVTLTDNEGHVRKFVANDKKQKLDIITAVVDARAKWDAGTFTTEMSVGSLKVTTTYQVTVEGHQLVVTSQTQGGGRGVPTSPVPVTHTYDKAQ